MKINYKLEDKPPLPQSIVLAIQHILASFNGIIAVPLVVGGAMMLAKADMSAYISAAIFCAGLVTLIQVLAPLGIGSRLPCIMGTSFTFVGLPFLWRSSSGWGQCLQQRSSAVLWKPLPVSLFPL